MSETVKIEVAGKSFSLSKWVAVALAALCVFLICWIVWKDYFRPVDRSGQVVAAKPAVEVAGVSTSSPTVHGGAVQVFPDAVKPKLNLPGPVAADVKKKVVAASKIAASDRPHTVTTLLDTGTGQFETYVRSDPLPWVAFTARGAAGVYYGMKNGQQAIRLHVRQDLVQFKAVHAGVIGSIDQAGGKTDTFVGVGLEYRW